MAHIGEIRIEKFRSIENATVRFPERTPVALIGENNAGKSNILEAFHIILGEQWPGTRTTDDRDHYFRNSDEPISITVDFLADHLLANKYSSLTWSVDHRSPSEPVLFKGFLGSTKEWRFIRGEERDDCICVFVGADRNLAYQLSYATKFTMLSRLMHKFHQTLKDFDDVRKELEDNFAKTKGLFERIASYREFKQTLQDDFLSLVSSMSYKLEIDMSAYNPTNFFHALRVQAKEGEHIRDFNEFGTGEQQILAMSFAHAYAKAFHRGVLLAIEEPESHLHPLAQQWLAERIRIMCADGLQVVLTTHSPSFINLMDLDGVVLVRRDEQKRTYVKQISRAGLAEYCRQHGVSKADPANILEFYAATTSEEILKGFFARRIVLIEGATEAMALPVYLRAAGLNTLKEGIEVVPVGGKGNLARYWRLFSAYGIPTYVIFDNDSENDEDAVRRRDLLLTLNPAEDVASMTKVDSLLVTDSYAIFGADFEKCLRETLKPFNYEAKERAARLFIGLDPNDLKSCKPLVARSLAQNLAAQFDESNVAWQWLVKLKHAVENIAVPIDVAEELPF